jgi:putative oxidoreductase
MHSAERYAMVAARVLVAMMFLLNGLDIIGQTLAMHDLAAYGAPASLIPTLVIASRTLQLVAGTCLILGIYPRISALALLLFLILATLMAHPFWKAIGTSLYQPQLINFSKNVSMAGGLIFIIAARNQPVLLPRRARSSTLSNY